MALQRSPLLFLLFWLIFQPANLSAEDRPLSFETEIAPLFADHCVRCHSPDNTKGGVSLASMKDLQANGYVTAGNPEESYLLELVTSQDGKPPAMPQEAAPLSEKQVALLTRWIKEGAHWPKNVVVKQKSKADDSWWSLQPLRHDFAALSQSNRNRGLKIDDFIRQKLSEQQLTLSPPADRSTLIRRLAFDLHGLPPDPAEVDAFVSDPDPRAYEKLVDRMLASPLYGERMAQHWLDLAHYADTHGFERDKRRDNAWRYRDYVIASFNADKPYPRFLQEQIAGDVLWPKNEQATIATGFLAAGPWDFVGQVETKSDVLRRAARSLDLDDMATQVMTACMGITINCARCHDHKLDPITQKEYYQLRAVFAGVKRAERVVSDSAIKAYESRKQELTAELNEIDYRISRLEGTGVDLADIVGGGNGLGTGAFRQGIDARTAKVQTRDFGALGNVKTNRFVAADFEFIDGVFIPDGQAGKAKIVVSSTGTTVSGLPATTGKAWDMIRNGPVASQHSPELDGINFTEAGHSLLGLHANAGITFDLEKIRSSTQLTDLQFTAKLGYFGAGGVFHADVRVFVDGQEVAKYIHLKRDDGLQQLSIPLSPSSRFLTLIATDGGNGYSHDQVGFGDPRLKSALPQKPEPAQERELKQRRKQRDEVASQLKSLGPPPRFYGVVANKTLPDVHLLVRGNPEAPDKEALAPAALHSLKMLDPELGTTETSEGQRRAALAEWITNPENPLTQRVIVNRLWLWHFGQGIVKTPSDFGYGGGRPSHPELLDWLAGELQRQNGSLKAVQRLILLSDTYRQQSRARDDQRGYQVDADNRLLWHQNPRRREAEAIRDAVLFVSGKLNRERGGPGFEDFKYQDAYAPIYTYVTADKPALWRRSIYRYRVRTTPNRFLTTLDCPDPANLTARRLTTTTPLQSLALYNNEFMLRQARYFAERIKSEAGSAPVDQVQRAFQLALGRKPSPQESSLAVDFVKQQDLFALCRSLLNSNEFVYVD
ncbi:DUF1553 domain-containing protein [Gimesia panareensis]|uniref:DUF1553 domain-containing protein n=1 Tax=Gimesia panareensis TaxID=2527978 RepID=UPI001189FA3A|nr:DUF1553 domain-containing protein [Gimesia panareensis]QDU50655.1 Planctomycete cytochrome C [Gimesia panareensis]